MIASTRRRSTRWAAIAFPVAWMFLAACGTAPPKQPVFPPPPGAAAIDTSRSTLSGGSVPAIVDSTPTPEAQALLRTIPEPLPPGEQVPPPEPGTLTTVPPAAAGRDTGAAGQAPVPAPTVALGQRPPPASPSPASPPPSSSPSSSPAPSGTVTGTGAPRPTSPPPSGECWRVQVSASTTRANADRARSTAESVLMVPMVVEQEGAYFKNRTRDCLDRDSADRLKARAVAGGFTGAFRLAGAARP